MASSFIPALRFSFLTGLYDPVVKLTTRESLFKRSLLNQANIQTGESVLDVGCGTGTLAVAASKLVPGAKIVGLDGDKNILLTAEAKAQYEGVTVCFTHSLSTQMPYESESFDKALSTLFFHHLTRDDKLATLEQLYRVLVPGGQLHVADWGKPTGRIPRLLFYFVQMLDGFETTSDNVQGRLPELFSDTGFCNIQISEEINTMFGTLSLYQAEKPCDAA